MLNILIIVFITFDLFFVIYILWRRRHKKITPSDELYIQNKWRKIKKEVISDPRQAIMEADKLLDFTLSRLGYTGHLGKKLKAAPTLFSNIDGVWKAHKLRNQIAHELDFQISDHQCKQALKEFHRACQDLGIRF